MRAVFLSLFTAFLVLTPVSYAASLVTRTGSLVSCLKSSLSPQASVVLPYQSGFAYDTARYSELYAPTFRVISQVAAENDVRISIKCAQETNTTFLVTGPRHGFSERLQELEEGLEIYTQGFNHVTIDAAANTMTCGGATTFAQVIEATYAAKKEIPTGSGLCVGMLGAGLGGGIGRLEGLHGLIIDSLLSVRIMLPNTTVVEASENMNPDLFWGLRGAGWNFGFVLNATFRVYDEVPNGLHLNADLLYPANTTGSLLQSLKDEAPNMPAALSIATGLSYNTVYNTTTLLVNAVFAGPEEEGLAAIKFLLDQGPILQRNISVVPWNNLIQTSFFGTGGGGCDKGAIRRSVSTAAFNQIDPAAHVRLVQLFDEMITKYPQTSTSSIAIYFPATQAARAVPGNSTAYSWRQALGHMAFEITFSDNTSTDATTGNYYAKWRDTIVHTAGTEGLQAYIGFSHGDEPLESNWSREKLPRLAALKKRYDPSGMFNAYRPLPTKYLL
ncbi:hypothetical protein KCV07_g10092, partial [Aureobasidium melanogenum]